MEYKGESFVARCWWQQQSTWEKPVPLSLCPPQISRRPNWDRTRVSAVTDRRLEPRRCPDLLFQHSQETAPPPLTRCFTPTEIAKLSAAEPHAVIDLCGSTAEGVATSASGACLSVYICCSVARLCPAHCCLYWIHSKRLLARPPCETGDLPRGLGAVTAVLMRVTQSSGVWRRVDWL